MALYSALHPTVEANQWFRNGDHPDDHTINRINTGRIVGRYVPSVPHEDLQSVCKLCEKPMHVHGSLAARIRIWDNVTAASIPVCPGDYIQTHRNDKGRVIGYSLLKRELFEHFYGPYREQQV